MNSLPAGLVNRVLARLGIEKPAVPDLASLQHLYGAWCRQLPFDNIRKMISLRSGSVQPLPGLDATDFFENWLEHGSGGTCWPLANAFCSILETLGFRASRIAGAMRDLGMLNHGSVKVNGEGKVYLAEASLLLHVILPLDTDTRIHHDPLCPVELEKEDDTWLLWIKTPPSEEYFSCRLNTKELTYSIFEERYEASRTASVFNQRLYAKRNHADEMIILHGNTRYAKTRESVEQRELTKEELCDAMHRDIGISYKMIHEWAAYGGLDASFEKQPPSHPPPATRRPPSLRQR